MQRSVNISVHIIGFFLDIFTMYIVTVQLDKVEIHELRPKVLTEDKSGLV